LHDAHLHDAHLHHVNIISIFGNMDIPFVYGKTVTKSAFVNRTSELKELKNNFNSLTNTTIISPRRWGKSSLVLKAAKEIERKNKNYRICFIDLYKVRTEEEFYKLYAETIINATSTKIEDTIKSIKRIFSSIIPNISFSPDAQSEISLSLDWAQVKMNPNEILEISQKIAKEKKLKIIVCLDEFQSVSNFLDSGSFQKQLRAVWQNHDQVAYCLYGSKRHMMIELFSSQEMPFYKFGNIMFLEKIVTKHWQKYIKQNFEKTGKKISEELTKEIIESAENHSYYVQQLAQMVWLRTEKECTEKIVNQSIEKLQLQFSMIFQQLTDTLSNKQVNVLKAIINNTF